VKVTDIQAFNLANRTVLVKVTTDEGIVGWGECSPMQPPVIVAHIEHTLARLVVGEDPFDLERLVERMFVTPYKIAGQALATSFSPMSSKLADFCDAKRWQRWQKPSMCPSPCTTRSRLSEQSQLCISLPARLFAVTRKSSTLSRIHSPIGSFGICRKCKTVASPCPMRLVWV
jgi:hypothetical protein